MYKSVSVLEFIIVDCYFPKIKKQTKVNRHKKTQKNLKRKRLVMGVLIICFSIFGERRFKCHLTLSSFIKGPSILMMTVSFGVRVNGQKVYRLVFIYTSHWT